MPAMLVTFVVGVVSFAALGMAVAGLCQTAASASAVANVIILPMAFISDVFIPLQDPPQWLDVLGDILPLKPFVQSVPGHAQPERRAARVRPRPSSPSSPRGGCSASLVALRWFKWEPSRAGPTRRRRRSRPAIEVT